MMNTSSAVMNKSSAIMNTSSDMMNSSINILKTKIKTWNRSETNFIDNKDFKMAGNSNFLPGTLEQVYL